jgi:hypothetical protein
MPTPTEPVVGEVEQFIRDAVASMEPDQAEREHSGRGKPRVLPSLALWAGLLVCVLRGFSSKLELWRLLNSGQFWFYPRFPVSDEAVYDRLERAGTAPMDGLFGQITALLRERLAPFVRQDLAPFAREVVALDETTLDPVARKLPALRGVPKGDRRLLPGKLAGLFDLRRQQWIRVQYIPDPSQNEKVAARGMVDRLARGSLILADLGYFGFAWFDALSDLGHWWVSRLRSKTSYTLVHTFYQGGETFDGLVFLGAHRADRAAHAVRLVRFREGNALYSYVTNVLDPAQLPLREVARLYARRWDIELAVKLVKTHLGLHLLWSTKDVTIVQQVLAVLIISQILMALRMEIAARAEADPFEVSMELLVRHLPQYAYTGADPVAAFVSMGRELRLIRPSTRTAIRAPAVPLDQLNPMPPDLVLIRNARHANRKCGPR